MQCWPACYHSKGLGLADPCMGTIYQAALNIQFGGVSTEKPFLSRQVPYVPQGLEAVIFTADGDMRQALNNLQATHFGFGLVDADAVFKVLGHIDSLLPPLCTGLVTALLLNTHPRHVPQLYPLLLLFPNSYKPRILL